jgi:diphthamide synthase (EF-2-diphthine--ammonia ligase)
MHGVRRSLVLDQAEALDLPLYEVFIPKGCSIDVYEERMSRAMSNLKQIGVEGVVFGDIYLEDVRRYREENLAKIGVEAIFPLWGWDPYLTARRFIELGFKAVVICVDSRILDESFTGKLFDQSFPRESIRGYRSMRGEGGIPYLRIRWTHIQEEGKFQDR